MNYLAQYKPWVRNPDFLVWGSFLPEDNKVVNDLKVLTWKTHRGKPDKKT